MRVLTFSSASEALPQESNADRSRSRHEDADAATGCNDVGPEAVDRNEDEAPLPLFEDLLEMELDEPEMETNMNEQQEQESRNR